MTNHSDRDGSELNRFTSPQEATGATPAPLDTSMDWESVIGFRVTIDPFEPVMVHPSQVEIVRTDDAPANLRMQLEALRELARPVALGDHGMGMWVPVAAWDAAMRRTEPTEETA